MKRVRNDNVTSFTSRPECAKFVDQYLSSDAADTAVVSKDVALSHVYGNGQSIVSDVPTNCVNKNGVCLGIDEAGRGSVLGPMIYGAAYWNHDLDAKYIPADFNDSKQLSDIQRTRLFNNILHKTPQIGFCFRVLQASEISRNMLRKEPYNLNQMSHDAAASLIQRVLDAGVTIQTCYIDTVGNADYYKSRLQREFPGLSFVVESKADANYPVCSAASVVAKVTRDRLMENWKYTEPMLADQCNKFGSGYPSDPVCKAWLDNNLSCRVFGYADVVRFSWKPTKTLLENRAYAVKFKADEDEDEHSIDKQRAQMKSYFGKNGNNDTSAKRVRYSYFADRGLKPVELLGIKNRGRV